MVNTAARFRIPAAIIGVFTGVLLLTQLGAIAYAVALAFQFLTLPVEFDARKRALAQLDQLKFLNAEE
jgi:Zn-dependent membrane protease YugP